MDATANDNEIIKFKLKKDDVVITKDSETRDDIGMACHIKDDLENTLLGYHCALIRPKDVDGGYLNICLQSKLCRNYFSNQASGSGQRYTLTEKGIGDVKIPMVSIEMQKKISNLIGNINSKIRVNNRINDNLQQLIMSIYNQWFYRFDYPNSCKTNNNNPIVIDKDFEKTLPDGWKIETLASNSLCSFIDVGIDRFVTKNYLATANVNGCDITDGENITYENRESRANMQPSLNSVWLAKMKNSIKHIFISKDAKWMVDKYIFSTGFTGFQCTDESFPYIASLIMQNYIEITKDTLSHGATQESVNNDDLDSIPVIIPSNEVLQKYSKIVGPYFIKMNQIMQENQQLSKLRNELSPLLMNGQISIA